MINGMNGERHNRASLIAFLCLLAIVSVFFLAMIVPYMLALLMGGILALLASPAYNFLLRKKYHPKRASLIVTLSLVVLVIVPLFGFTIVAVKQGISLSEQLSGGSGFSLVSISKYITRLPITQSILDNFDIAASQARSGIQSVLKSGTGAILVWFSDIPRICLHLFLSSLACFFFLIDGKRFVALLMDLLFMEESIRKNLIDSVQNAAISVVLANLAATTAQAVIVMIGFLVLGVPGPFLAAGAAFILAWLPVIGPVPVWVVGTVYLYAQHKVGFAIAMVIFGIVCGIVDNIVRPMVLKGNADMHPLLSLVAIFGGISTFGILGVIVGPLLAAIVMSLLQVWPIVRRRFGVKMEQRKNLEESETRVKV
ncbi:MAG: hypothetical protein A2901_06085 [Elusimicrobia bacterium RIFCSPLOWO2_01_FULL_54_10]|nr:MAG: hypothetical protein A2901_06085 [Elusimicrobia bacterium RIFCSPLOWO2_01_FULL_54_10]